jgi:hypothetical protein
MAAGAGVVSVLAKAMPFAEAASMAALPLTLIYELGRATGDEKKINAGRIQEIMEKHPDLSERQARVFLRAEVLANFRNAKPEAVEQAGLAATALVSEDKEKPGIHMPWLFRRGPDMQLANGAAAKVFAEVVNAAVEGREPQLAGETTGASPSELGDLHREFPWLPSWADAVRDIPAAESPNNIRTLCLLAPNPFGVANSEADRVVASMYAMNVIHGRALSWLGLESDLPTIPWSGNGEATRFSPNGARLVSGWLRPDEPSREPFLLVEKPGGAPVRVCIDNFPRIGANHEWQAAARWGTAGLAAGAASGWGLAHWLSNRRP